MIPVTAVGVSDATAIGTGCNHSCAVSKGAIYCWGANDSGQLGDGTTDSSNVPVEVIGITGAVSIDVGATHACALLDDGKVWCWGNNQSGQLGDGTGV